DLQRRDGGARDLQPDRGVGARLLPLRGHRVRAVSGWAAGRVPELYVRGPDGPPQNRLHGTVPAGRRQTPRVPRRTRPRGGAGERSGPPGRPVGHPAAMNLGDVIREFRRRRVTVVGDAMLDEDLVGPVDRICPEAPVPIVRVETTRV